jgi:cobalt-zinc-cadmium efflux system protein
MGHQHDHSSGIKNIRLAFFLNLAFTIIEAIGGVWVNSVAILSDALHDLGDSLSLGLAWYLQRKSGKSASKNYSFGYARFSLLGALINGLILLTGSIFIISEAVERILAPEDTSAEGMIGFAVLGIVVNGYAAWKVSTGKSMNERVVSWHLLEDVLGWAAVLVGGLLLLFFDLPFLDPALSIGITLFVLWNVAKRLRETFHIFLQGVPVEIDLEKIRHDLLALGSVASLHHTHVWSLEGSQHVFTTHVILRDIDTFDELQQAKRSIQEVLAPYRFSHCTVEVELEGESCSLAAMGDG